MPKHFAHNCSLCSKLTWTKSKFCTPCKKINNRDHEYNGDINKDYLENKYMPKVISTLEESLERINQK